MPRPAKTIGNTLGHRTNAEKKQRKDAESALITGVSLRERLEVKRNPVAHAEFLRVNKLLVLVGKNDALIEAVINRYCMIQAECAAYEKRIAENQKLIDELGERKGEMDFISFLDELKGLNSIAIYTDKQIQTKRKMLLDIEKENGLTVAAALRSIPKKVDKEDSLLAKALMGDD